MNVCIDSSLLVSLYIPDSHSPEAIGRMASRPTNWISPLNRSELAHAIHQHVFRGAIGPLDAQRAWSAFENDCASGIWNEAKWSDAVWHGSIELARNFGPTLGMRTLDSLHVACALELRAERFWTFDERQVRLAEAAGLNTKP